MAQRIILPRLIEAEVLVDATAGNGKDALFLAQNSSANAELWLFDIQTRALKASENLLAAADMDKNVYYIKDNHADIDKHINKPIDIIMFNLGYLPGSNRTVTTDAQNTLIAIDKSLKLLKSGGIITVVAYPGYPTGKIETEHVYEYLARLEQRHFTVGVWNMLNQVNNPPILFAIEKRSAKK